jgi:methionyl-tRNA formyltransferase
MTVRVAFLGNDPWSVPSLEALREDAGIEVSVAITNPPRPAGRGSSRTPTAVADAARRLGITLAEVDGIGRGEGAAAVRDAQPDALAVVAYGELLSPENLTLAPLGAINVHFSLLPRWRGAAPVTHALLAGDDVTGVTVMRMDEGLDTGPVLNQLEEPIRPEDDAGSLGARLARVGGILLVAVLRRLETRELPDRPQDEARATLAPKLDARARRIDWTQPPDRIVRLVRALAPDPAATTSFREQPLKVLAAGVAHDPLAPGTPPGTVAGADPRGVLVAAAAGGVRLTVVAPAGRRRMDAAAWARGARFAPGERLG